MPRSPDEITPEWLTAVLCADTPGARVEQIAVPGGSVGTTTRKALHVSYNEAGSHAALPSHLFAKCTTALAQRLVLGLGGFITGESGFFNHVRPGLEIEAPRGYHGAVDPRSWRSVTVMEDVAATKGAQFAAGDKDRPRPDRGSAGEHGGLARGLLGQPEAARAVVAEDPGRPHQDDRCADRDGEAGAPRRRASASGTPGRASRPARRSLPRPQAVGRDLDPGATHLPARRHPRRQDDNANQAANTGMAIGRSGSGAAGSTTTPTSSAPRSKSKTAAPGSASCSPTTWSGCTRPACTGSIATPRGSRFARRPSTRTTPGSTRSAGRDCSRSTSPTRSACR